MRIPVYNIQKNPQACSVWRNDRRRRFLRAVARDIFMNYNAENERGVFMIYDTLEHAGQYRKLSGNLAKALDYLTGTELETVEAGRVEIDGERVFALFQSYETKPENDRPEAHRKYIDIQYLIEGEELIGVAPLASMERVAEAAPERDIWFYEGETAKLPLGGGRFAILFPQDAHAPCIAAGECRPVRKVVVKVAVEPAE